jgi:thiamine-monophosphate kinase
MIRKGTEDALIQRIAKGMPSATSELQTKAAAGRTRLLLGIGDDAAVITTDGRTDLVLSCDAFLEGIHFLADAHPADSVGYKALARAASDLGAMGAVPKLFLLTLAIPASRTGAWLDGFIAGMGKAARLLGMRLAGGDTTKAEAVAISVTVVGEVAHGRAVRRDGARPGDAIYTSGVLGRAQLGLELLRRGWAGSEVGGGGARRRVRKGMALSAVGGGSGARVKAFLQAHLYPRIPIALGAWLAQKRVASAMMDISDGLSTDLARLCKASGVGTELVASEIPCVKIPADIARKISGTTRGLPGKGLKMGLKRHLPLDLNIAPDMTSDMALDMAMNGGDDYELVFTVPRRRVKQLRGAPGFSKLRAIGTITAEKGMKIVDARGRSRPLRAGGWDPFGAGS